MIGAIVVAALACAALAFVAAPLRARDDVVGDESPEKAELLDRKRAALTAILDMEDERDAGKLSPGDFAALRSEYEADAADALMGLDALRESSATGDDELEAEIAAIRARLQENRGSPRRDAKASGAPQGRGRASKPCPSCGSPRAPGRACEQCGA